MKPSTILIICLLSFNLVHCNTGPSKTVAVSNGKEMVSISENSKVYTLDANFDEEKTMDVFRFINESVKPTSLLSSGKVSVDANVFLSDGGMVHIKASSGELKLTFDKRAHSKEAYHRVKDLGDGVKKICDVR